MNDVAPPRLYERDIDVLLQEELLFNSAVRSLVRESLRLEGPFKVEQCRLSVVDSSGETDVHAEFTSGGYRGHLLIENKIDAAFQPRQPERYRERATALKSGDIAAFCLLIAPSRYVVADAEAFSHFDAIVSYEALAEAVAAEGTPRSKHRAALLLRAVEEARSSYTLAPSEDVTALWRRVFEIVDKEYPELAMKAPGEKGGSSDWFLFKGNLPPKITIDWKLRKSVVDLSFWKAAPYRPSPMLEASQLPIGARSETIGDTVAIRIGLAPVPRLWTDISDEAIRSALQSATTLLQFHQKADWGRLAGK